MQYLPSNFPDMNANDEWQEIDDAILDHYESSKMQPHAEESARKFVRGLERLLNRDDSGVKQLYNGSEVVLSIVGSLGSGIATIYSDVDICVRFKTSPTEPPAEEQLRLSVLRKIGAVVKPLSGVGEVTEIFKTTVPIIRFTVRRDNITFNIKVSYYNMTSLYSSSLVAAYCEWEPQLPALIMYTKKWAKFCKISHPTRKALPKYAFTIMLIHYLQQCSPRILPRLQHDFVKFDDAIDKAAPYYFHRNVESWWYKTNDHSVGRLFFGFLKYFSTFNFKGDMISMRTQHKNPIPSMRGRFMMIENPFNRRHNLGWHIEKKMFDHIVYSFEHSHKVFWSLDLRNSLIPTTSNENYSKSLWAGLLNQCFARNCPEMRQCSSCNLYGHDAQYCRGIAARRILAQSPPPNRPLAPVAPAAHGIAQQNAAQGG